MEKIIFIFLFSLLTSCTNVEFVLNSNNSKNVLKDNTSIIFKGNSEPMFSQEISSYLNNAKGDYILITAFTEEKENRLVKQNQVAEKIDYKIIVDYELFYKNRNCKILGKKIISEFSFVPKSFGYNFGTDRSFEKLYKNSIKKNINNFVDSVPSTKKCIE
tara:strand:- start:231 stop:710 length:480 start_codon:yes stop_codon:yes gene_type:complete